MRFVHFRHHRRRECILLLVGDDADDRSPDCRRAGLPEREALAERITAAEVGARESLVHEDDRHRTDGVGGSEVAAAEDGNAGGLEKTGGDGLVAQFPAGDGRPALDMEIARPQVAVEGEPGGRPCCANAARLPQALERRGVERGDLRRLVVADSRQRHPEGHGVRHVDARIDAPELGKAARDQPGADEQHHRQRDLGANQQAAQPRAGRRGRAAAVLQCRRWRPPDAVPRRGDAEDQGCREAGDDQEPEHDWIERHAGDSRHVGRPVRPQPGDGDSSDADAEDGGGDCEQAALDQELTKEPQRARAQGGANRQLAATARRPRQQQAGDVGAGDEEDAADRRHQQHERPAVIADEPVVQQADAGAHAGVGVRILSFERAR